MSTLNRTESTPEKRMAVARATFEGIEAVSEYEQAIISAHVCQVIKNGLPTVDVVAWTHIDTFFSGNSCTVTVQAFARGSLAWAARLGAGAAFAMMDGKVTVEMVQEI